MVFYKRQRVHSATGYLAPAEFAIGSDSGEATLTAGATRTIQISFDPSSPGAKLANVSIVSNDGDEPTVNVSLSGNGLNPGSLPEIMVLPGNLAFGNQGADNGPTPSQMVTNNGNGDLHISSRSLTGANPAEFAIESDSGEATLTAGATRTIQISCDPSSPGAKSANLSTVSDDGDEPAVNVTLSGNGLSSSVEWHLSLPLELNNN